MYYILLHLGQSAQIREIQMYYFLLLFKAGVKTIITNKRMIGFSDHCTTSKTFLRYVYFKMSFSPPQHLLNLLCSYKLISFLSSFFSSSSFFLEHRTRTATRTHASRISQNTQNSHKTHHQTTDTAHLNLSFQ